jgi:hypothetical protein
MLDTAIAERSMFDFQILPALTRFIKGFSALFGEKEQPVTVEYVGPALTGSSFDASQDKFFVVHFLDADVKTEDREKPVIAQDGINLGSVYWLNSLDRNTLEYSLLPPAEQASGNVLHALKQREVPLWLLQKLEDAAASASRQRYESAVAAQQAKAGLPKLRS